MQRQVMANDTSLPFILIVENENLLWSTITIIIQFPKEM